MNSILAIERQQQIDILIAQLARNLGGRQAGAERAVDDPAAQRRPGDPIDRREERRNLAAHRVVVGEILDQLAVGDGEINVFFSCSVRAFQIALGSA